MYKAVPEDAQRPLHILARGAQYPRSVEDAKALVVKPVEVQDVGHCMRWGRWVARNFVMPIKMKNVRRNGLLALSNQGAQCFVSICYCTYIMVVTIPSGKLRRSCTRLTSNFCACST